MAVYAISDLHLPAREKPMDIFGEHWANHFDRISEDWKARVTQQDIVLLPGETDDVMWASFGKIHWMIRTGKICRIIGRQFYRLEEQLRLRNLDKFER